MEKEKNPLQNIVDACGSRLNFVIVLDSHPTAAALYAARALQLGLQSIGKNVSVFSTGNVHAPILPVQFLTTTPVVEGSDLVISLPYIDGKSIEKVDYQVKDGMFNLIILNTAGYPRIQPTDIIYSYAGGQTECAVYVDIDTIEKLEDAYAAVNTTNIFKINIGTTQTNTHYGDENYVVPGVASSAELVLDILRSLNVVIQGDIASCLLYGLMCATKNFTHTNTTNDTFETAALLYRAGAKSNQTVAQYAFGIVRTQSRNGLSQHTVVRQNTTTRDITQDTLNRSQENDSGNQSLQRQKLSERNQYATSNAIQRKQKQQNVHPYNITSIKSQNNTQNSVSYVPSVQQVQDVQNTHQSNSWIEKVQEAVLEDTTSTNQTAEETVEDAAPSQLLKPRFSTSDVTF